LAGFHFITLTSMILILFEKRRDIKPKRKETAVNASVTTIQNKQRVHLTNSTQQNPSWKTSSRSAGQAYLPPYMEPKGLSSWV
jgi:hypothetical protein